MAYLTPILSALMHPTTYADLPTVNSPLAIVLVPSWIKAQTLYDIASMFVSGLEKLRVMTVYGGGAEETHYISLINGCELLIATPPCLTRMLDKRYVLLDRLSHLVRQLMKQYFHVLKNEEERLAPQQIVIMSSQWCSPIEDFVKAFMLDPTIVITSKFESAVYGKINQVPHMCKSNQRIREITNIIDGISDGTKTMIFCSTVNKVLDLMRILKAHSVFAIECHSQMELLTLEYKVQEWNEPSNKYGPKIMVKSLFSVYRREHKCEQRHTILCEVDAPVNDKLTAGEVKVRVVNVVDASRYYVRVLEHRFDGTKEDHSTDCLVLLKEITSWYSDNLNRVKYENLVFVHVKVENANKTKQTGNYHYFFSSTLIYFKSLVHFVDEGRFEDVSMDKLFELPPHLHTIPFQVMEAYICRIRPVDKDEDWTVNANTAAHEIVEGKVLEGRIVLCIGNTLWLDPLVERQYLTETKIWVNSMFVRTQLLRKGFAVDNPQHIQKLYEVCQGKIHIPDANKKLQSPEESVETDEMSDSVDFHEVFVSEMDMPDLIFLQRNEGNKRMDVMLDDMNAKMEELDPAKRDNSNLKAGSHCLAKLDDCRWYRVKILQIIGNKVEVFCADYGDKQLVDENSLTRICQEFTHLPFQAIECQLADVQPRGEEWVKESGDALWDMTHHVNEDKKRLVAKVVSKSPAMFAGRFKYAVELYDTTTADDVNLAQELVWSGLAAPKEGSNLKDQKRHITPDGEILAIVTNTIQRAKVDGKVFAFNYSLYGKIVPSLCKSLVKSGEVLVSLRKAEKGRWKRLLRQEHRPQNLSIDFDRYIDTSSDNEEIALCTDNEPFILKKTFRSLPKFSRPATLAETPKLKSESETETDSDEDNIYGADFGPIDDYNADPYDLFGCKG
ncbi:hypothetical protein FSP39_003420 [Pinctada imbricata]|uniref:RNA helicase n=1 Tax=Pinctada imbricata TaxID=66713 RepID=A0AA89BSZ8_PINIB|nr:hypothetical protein FSP39_003420 [Pinctada imbricata]